MSSTAFAETSPSFSEFFQFLQDPNGEVQSIECEETSGAPHCQDLAAAVCAQPRGTVRANLETQLKASLDKSSYDTHYSSIMNAHREALARIPASSAEIKSLFNSIKGNLIRMVGDQPGIPNDVKDRMKQTAASTRILMPDEYFEDQFRRITAKYPNDPANEIRADIMEAFTNNCGDTGMNESAFAIDDTVVVCPGVLLQGIDGGADNKEEYLNSLTVIFAHEAAHPIGKDFFPDVYQQMGNCLNEVSGKSNYWEQKGDEISADYWATRLFSQRLATTGTSNQHAVDAVAQNFGSLCTSDPIDSYPSVQDRMNLLFGRNPVMRQVMGCEAPTAEKPVCGLLGKQP